MQLFENSRAMRMLRADAQAGRLSHAYLFLCPDARNLRRWLKELAAVLLGADARAKRLIAEECYSDCRIFPAPGEKAGVAEVKAMLDDVYIKPVEGEKKAFVLDNVQDMLAPAQNKLLKVLEEPPENTIFFLGATNESTILATVKSRCQQVRLDDTSFEEVMKYLTSSGISEADAEIAACFADGRPLTAEKYATDRSFYKIFDEVTETVKSLSSSKDALKASAKLSSYGAGTQTVLRMLLLLYRQTLAAYADEEMLLLKHKKNDILFIKGMYSPEALYRVVDLLTQAKIRLDGNCNLSAVIDGLVLSILEVKYSCRR